MPVIPRRGGTTNNNNEQKNKQKPIVVIDGPNVACEYSGSRPGDALGILATYRYWKDKGHNVAVFIKKHRLHNERNPKVLLENVEELLKEIPKQSLTTVPAKGDDDSYMIDYCMDKMAIVVTNDQFKDHEEKYEGDEKKQFIKWRKTHRCGYAFALGEFRPAPDFKIQFIEANPSHTGAPQPKPTTKAPTPKLKESRDKSGEAKANLSPKTQTKNSTSTGSIHSQFKRDLLLAFENNATLRFNDILDIAREIKKSKKQTWAEFYSHFEMENGHLRDNIPLLLKNCNIQHTLSKSQSIDYAHFVSTAETKMTTEMAISVVLDIMDVPTEFRGRTNFLRKFIRGLGRKPTLFEMKYSLVSTKFLEQTGYKLKTFYSSFSEFRAEFTHFHSRLTAQPMVGTDTFIIRTI